MIADVRQRYGRLDVFIHAGGLLVDRTLPNKEPAQFDLVFDVKADGWFNLMSAAADLPLLATVAFSSVAGRFGNNGQTDYSAANDLLCKLTSGLVRARPGARGIAIDWTAWGGIGMASRGSVPQIMESLGVDMLPPESGVPTVRRELISGNAAGEVVVAGRLGAWLEERDPQGGLDAEKARTFLAGRQPRLPLVERITACKLYGGVEIETTLDPKEQPFLYDHAPDPETPWLPGVMATEALAEAAVVLAPGYHVAAVENVQMLGAFKFFRMEPRTVYLSAVVMAGSSGELVARATLRSVTRPAKEGLPGQVKDHFVADVRLQRSAPSVEKVTFEPPTKSLLDTGRDDIYRLFFHGPGVPGARVGRRAAGGGGGCAAPAAAARPGAQGAERPCDPDGPPLDRIDVPGGRVLELAAEGRNGVPAGPRFRDHLQGPRNRGRQAAVCPGQHARPGANIRRPGGRRGGRGLRRAARLPDRRPAGMIAG